MAMIKRDEKGRFIEKHEHTFTKETASEMGKRGQVARKQKAVAAATEGLLKGLPPGAIAKDVWGGVATVVQALAEMVFAKEGHSSVRAAELVLKMVDAMPSQKESDVPNVTLQFPGIEIIANRLLEVTSRRVVNAEELPDGD